MRVVRKANGGYSHDGLYRVERYWPAKGKSGFVIYRYRLLLDDLTIPDDLPDPSIGPGSAEVVYGHARRSGHAGRQRGKGAAQAYVPSLRAVRA